MLLGEWPVNASYFGFPCRHVVLHRVVLGLCLGAMLAIPFFPSDAFVGPRLDRASQGHRLSAADIERYRAIFAVQADGAWIEADELITQLENEILLGHVLAQRYLHPTQYRSRYQGLAGWLDRYSDHPDARRIYDLAVKRKPGNAASPHRPISAENSLAAELPLDTVYLYESKKKLTKSERRKVRRLKRRIRRNIRRTYLTKTEQLLERPEVRRLLDRFELDEAYSQVAAGWFYYGNADKAFQLASAVAERSGQEIPTSHWTAGLRHGVSTTPVTRPGTSNFWPRLTGRPPGTDRLVPTGRLASMSVRRIRPKPIDGLRSPQAFPLRFMASWPNAASTSASK